MSEKQTNPKAIGQPVEAPEKGAQSDCVFAPAIVGGYGMDAIFAGLKLVGAEMKSNG